MSHPFAEAREAPYVSVGKVEEWSDGQVREVKVHKKPMSVCRIGDKFFAVNSICPHMGGPLSCGALDTTTKKLTCPWHSWSFDVETGLSPNGHKLDRYEVKVEEGEVKVAWIIE
jgi:nitrite reductase (NADH) small subunit